MDAYLKRYAAPDALTAARRVRGHYQRVLVVPCFDEPATCLDRLLPADARDLLVVLVVNVPDNAAPGAAARTARLLRAVAAVDTLMDRHRGIGLLTIDRVTRPIPYRQGVGLARKIGVDCAAALRQAGKLAGDWVYSTDADVRLPEGYFTTPLPDRGAVVFGFRHRAPSPALQCKADLYELHLRYYQERLAWAGSPYAFHTLGSTMAVNVRDYATVRGFPRRNAGEDFYLLNKLAKVAPVTCLDSPVIEIRARYSQRTPFGTGAALAKMQDPHTYTSYAPASFVLLREVLAALADPRQHGLSMLSPKARHITAEVGLEAFLAGALRQHRQSRTLSKAVRDWFDGFRTLRFIHQCRRYYPDRHLQTSVGELFAELAGRAAGEQVAQLARGRPGRDQVSVDPGTASQNGENPRQANTLTA